MIGEVATIGWRRLALRLALAWDHGCFCYEAHFLGIVFDNDLEQD